MANQKLLKKVAPVVLSAAMAMTSMPAAAMAADFSDSDVVSDAVDVEETQDAEAEVEVDEDDADDTADVDVVEDNAADAAEADSEEDLFSSEVTEDEFSDQAGDDQTTGEAYVLMNIPYDDFYKAELKNNDVKVDAFTSATKNKSRTAGMMNGNSAYHVDPEGTDVSGVTFPVKVSDLAVLKDQKKVTDEDSVTITVTNRGQTASNTYTGKDSLIENASYSYYVLSEAPSYYKELTVKEDGSFAFSDVKGAEEKTVEATAELKTETSYGDYQLDINNETFSSLIDTNKDKIYGATVNTTDGTEYGMRHLENIWRGYELAWCTGFTTSVHGCPTSSEHYKSMMGKTIDSVTYYTDKGIITFDVNDEKVLTKTGVKASVANIHTTDTEAAVTLDGTLPEDFAAKYAVDGTEVAYADGKITVGTLTAGSHTLVISDANGVYAPIQVSFNAKEAAVPAVYDSENNKLVPAEGSTEDQLTAYIKTITAVTVGDKTYQATGRGAKVIVKEDGTLDFSGIEVTDGTNVVVTSSAYDDFAFSYVDGYKYVYAGLTWAQYWAAEGVYAAGDASSSDAKDRRGETDLGAFDAVTRATTNHGLHRGSFQAVAVIEGSKGSYTVSHWEGRNTVVFTDGKKATYNRGSLTFEDGTTDDMVDYKVTGLKYVPVKVKASDYNDFKAKYSVVENKGTLIGGYAEGVLSSYEASANVTADTNGLKEAVKGSDGSFSFKARTTGTDSGIKDQTLQKAVKITPTVKAASGSYGEFLRVDLNGDDYGALGDKMQAVKWTYYGNDSTRTKALASYGTKFAADNWMHKSMGIQLGLTDSIRCQLPENTDGTGYWSLTVYALGYEDYTLNFEATKDNIVSKKALASDEEKASLQKLVTEAESLKKDSYVDSSNKQTAFANLQTELDETKDLLNKKDLSSAEVSEQITHLTEAINAVKALKTKDAATTTAAPSTTKPATTTTVTNTTTVKAPAKTTVKLSKAKKTSIKISWKKVSGVAAYQIQYSTSKNFKKAKTVKVSAKSASKVLKKLKKNKKYYVRVRSYKVTKVNNKSKNVYSAWSAKKALKTKKK